MKPTKQTTIEAIPLKETCKYCDRVRWGNYQYLLNGEWRHEECSPGSRDWLEYYERLNKSQRKDHMTTLYVHYKR